MPGLTLRSLSAAVIFMLAQSASAKDAAANRDALLYEAGIEKIQQAILAKKLTAEQIVSFYLRRIQAFNGQCVDAPDGVLGAITTIPNAGQLNALLTLNLRPENRKKWGFNERTARSLTDTADNNPLFPDAIEAAKALDRHFAKAGKLYGSLHGIPVVIKDQYDTADLRTTSGADARYANDRPPHDAEVVARLRAAGAIILAKTNMGEYAGGDRSSFGGPLCNPYDTERSPGRSSGGAASAVSANLAVCAIAEETSPSIRNPAKNNNVVGLAPTQELVSRYGMIPASLFNDRVGPICRTVDDVARILDVIAGYDPKDELTAFAVGRQPSRPYSSYTGKASLKGLRIGVVREYMNKSLFSAADHETIAIIERELDHLRKQGAIIIDPGPQGALFQDSLQQLLPATQTSLFIKNNPKFAPAGDPEKSDQVSAIVENYFDANPVFNNISIRDIGMERNTGEGRLVLDLYLKRRGDRTIRSTEDLINQSSFFSDVRPRSGFSDKKAALQEKLSQKTLDLSARLQNQFAIQQIVLHSFAKYKLDALVYPTANVPAPKLGAPVEPTINGRSALGWTLLGMYGFPAITVPAGFTSHVYDRVAAADPTQAPTLTGPIERKLPVGIDFLTRPFDEPTLLRIAAAYQKSTSHRVPPPAFRSIPK